MMSPAYEIYVRLFVLVPLLFYTGFCILQDRGHTGSVLFHTMVVLTVATMLFFHLRYIVRVLRRVFRQEKFQREFGVFLMSLALFSLVWTMYEIRRRP